jgi:hypothetical protein
MLDGPAGCLALVADLDALLRDIEQAEMPDSLGENRFHRSSRTLHTGEDVEFQAALHASHVGNAGVPAEAVSVMGYLESELSVTGCF